MSDRLSECTECSRAQNSSIDRLTVFQRSTLSELLYQHIQRFDKVCYDHVLHLFKFEDCQIFAHWHMMRPSALHLPIKEHEPTVYSAQPM